MLEVCSKLELRVTGRSRTLASGYYAYVGSANISRPYLRVLRHFKRAKRSRWHIDYLTSSSEARVLGGIVLYGVSEDSLYAAALGSESLEAAFPRFGSTDRRSHVTHLFRIRSPDPLDAFRKLLELARGLEPFSIEPITATADSFPLGCEGGRPLESLGST